MKYKLPITFLLILFSITTSADILFSDSFESKDMSAPDNQPDSTNLINFNWERNNSTSVVSMDPESVAVYNNKSIYNVQPGNDWNAKDGQYSLRFRYAAGVAMTEQRFNLSAQTELWVRYWVRVPTNFYHGTRNNKFFGLWENTYGVLPLNIRWQTRPDGSGGALINVQDGGATAEILNTPFISVPEDRGRWMQVVLHTKTATSESASDGIIQLYRRWEGEPNFTNLHNIQNSTNQWNGEGAGWAKGYFFGWANDPYSSNTEWLVDNIEISNTSLLNIEDDSTPSPLTPPNFKATVIP